MVKKSYKMLQKQPRLVQYHAILCHRITAVRKFAIATHVKNAHKLQKQPENKTKTCIRQQQQ